MIGLLPLLLGGIASGLTCAAALYLAYKIADLRAARRETQTHHHARADILAALAQLRDGDDAVWLQELDHYRT